MWESCYAIADVLKQLVRESSLLAPDFRSFKRQELTFVVLNLFLLASLLSIQVLFSSFFGRPPGSMIAVLAGGFLANTIELIWIQRRKSLTPGGIVALTWVTITLN